MGFPRVSVIIPLYKGGKYVKESILSVLNQTYKNFEIVIVDNNASDESIMNAMPFVKEEPEKIRLIREPIQGVCSARNRGIIASKGELIALLDDDDVMYSDRLELQVQLFDKYPDSSMITCWRDFISHDGIMLSQNNFPEDLFWPKILIGETDYYRTSPFLFNVPSTMLFPKEKAFASGLYDVRFNPACGTEDVDFEFRMYKLGSIKVVDKSCIAYRVTDGIFEEQKWNGERLRTLTLWEKTSVLFMVMQEYLDLPPKIYKKKLKKIQSQWLREFGSYLMRFPTKQRSAKRLIQRALLAQPLDYKAWKSFFRTYYPRNMYPQVFHFETEIDFPKTFIHPPNFEELYFSISSRFL